VVSPLLRLNHRLRCGEASGLAIPEKGICKSTVFDRNQLAGNAFSTALQLACSSRQPLFDPLNCIVTAQDDGAFLFCDYGRGLDF